MLTSELAFLLPYITGSVLLRPYECKNCAITRSRPYSHTHRTLSNPDGVAHTGIAAHTDYATCVRRVTRVLLGSRAGRHNVVAFDPRHCEVQHKYNNISIFVYLLMASIANNTRVLQVPYYV